MKNSTYFDILNINTLQKPSPIEVSSCYIRMSVGLFIWKDALEQNYISDSA